MIGAKSRSMIRSAAGILVLELLVPERILAQDVDIVEQVGNQDRISVPGGYIELPKAGSWMVGPLDLTPTKHVVFLWATALLVLTLVLWAALVAAKRKPGDVPRGVQNLVEALVVLLRDLVVVPSAGPAGLRYLPFLLTLFLFILVANLLGLVPYGAAATSNLSVTAGLALLAFGVVEIAGIRERGWGEYLGSVFRRPPEMGRVSGWMLAIAMAPIELIGKFTRPFALAIRLMANMLGGKIVVLALLSLVFVFGSQLLAPFPVLMVVAVTLLKLFVAVLQAYVFILLTSVFIGLTARAD